VGHRVVHGGASFSNPVHVDEMVEEKSHSFSSWHRSTIQRTWKETSLQLFTSAKQMAVLTLLSIKQFL
jgi:acetate kinase